MFPGREIVAKVLMVGESQVGKTSIDNYFAENLFNYFSQFPLSVNKHYLKYFCYCKNN